MPRSLAWSTMAALGALVCLALLAACAPTTTVSVSPTEAVPPTPTPFPTLTATPVPTFAPTPTNVPIGWSVFVGQHFSIAYPPGWSAQPTDTNTGGALYVLVPPAPQSAGVEVEVYQVPQGTNSAYLPYCSGASRRALAGIAMAYAFGDGEGAFMRTWDFVNAQGTAYSLIATDAKGTLAVQARDDSILATFRPDSAKPWKC